MTDKDVRKYEVFRQKMLAAASGANDKIGGGGDKVMYMLCAAVLHSKLKMKI